MDITLVTTTFNDEVHGTDNDKKTGCGISLVKSENVTRFRRSGIMTDLKEITCPKCKTVLAKKLIKADQKEMKELLKMEKMLSKKGIEDDGIVPLGNTVAKITQVPENVKREQERKKAAAAAAARREAEEAERARIEQEADELAAQQDDTPDIQTQPDYSAPAAGKTIPGTGVPMDDSLAQFAINAPAPEAPQQAPAQDDFLSQFAIQKPDEAPQVAPEPAAPAYSEPAPAPVPAYGSPAAAPAQDDFLAQFAIPSQTQPQAPSSYNQSPFANGTPVYAAPAPAAPVYQEPAPAPNPAVPNIQSEEDILKMFAVDNTGAPQSPNMYVASEQPVYGYGQPSAPAYGQPAAPDYSQNYGYAQPAAPVYGQPAAQNYGYGQPVQGYEQPYAQPVIDEITPVQAETIEPARYDSAPALDEIAPPQVDTIEPARYQPNPVLDEIAPPSVGSIEPARYESTPVLDEIAPPEIGSIEPARYDSTPVLDEIAPPEIGSIEPARYDSAPALDEIAPSQLGSIEPAKYETQPALDDIGTLSQDEYFAEDDEDDDDEDFDDQKIEDMDDIQIGEDDMNKHRYSTPVFADEIAAAPVQPQPAPVMQPQQPRHAAAPQIITVPQLMGYDATGKPVYQNIQMQMSGVDANGMPVFTPLPNQPQPATMMQQPAPQPVQLAAQQPVQPKAPAVQPQQPNAPYVAPTANISKIAVNPHSKSTSQAFINAIASSKNYADKSLIETHGLQQNMPFLDSIEDVLSQMGDDSAKRALQQKAAQAKKNVPVYDEYDPSKANAKRGYAPSKSSSSSMSSTSSDDMRFMSKSELKAKKKQDKIDKKFRDDMKKRGL